MRSVRLQLISENSQMNKADEEILQILKKTFRKIPKNKFIDPDEVLNVKIIKATFFLLLLSIAVLGNYISFWQ